MREPFITDHAVITCPNFRLASGARIKLVGEIVQTVLAPHMKDGVER